MGGTRRACGGPPRQRSRNCRRRALQPDGREAMSASRAPRPARNATESGRAGFIRAVRPGACAFNRLIVRCSFWAPCSRGGGEIVVDSRRERPIFRSVGARSTARTAVCTGDDWAPRSAGGASPRSAPGGSPAAHSSLPIAAPVHSPEGAANPDRFGRCRVPGMWRNADDCESATGRATERMAEPDIPPTRAATDAERTEGGDSRWYCRNAGE